MGMSKSSAEAVASASAPPGGPRRSGSDLTTVSVAQSVRSANGEQHQPVAVLIEENAAQFQSDRLLLTLLHARVYGFLYVFLLVSFAVITFKDRILESYDDLV